MAAFRVYFARAVDGLPRSAVLDEGRALARRLRTVGAELVDPVADWDRRSDDPARGGPVVSDLRILRTCHAVLMDMTIPDRNYIGCVGELTYAHCWHIPSVVWVGDTGYDRRAWLRHHATAIVPDESEAMRWLEEVLASRSRGPASEE